MSRANKLHPTADTVEATSLSLTPKISPSLTPETPVEATSPSLAPKTPVEATSPSLAPKTPVEATSSSLAPKTPVEATSSSLPSQMSPSLSPKKPRSLSSEESGGHADGNQESGGDAASTGVLPVWFDPEKPIGHVRGGNLPHWRQDGVTYFVTWRTADSMPGERVEQWLRERDAWLARHPEPHNDRDHAEYDLLFSARWERWLDECHGECPLRQPEVKAVVEASLRHGDGRIYRLGEFVVMPNHVHVLVKPIGGRTLSEIVKGWKGFTAREINRLTGRKGTFWQKESFDHIVRSADQLERIRRYIRENPVNATPESL